MLIRGRYDRKKMITNFPDNAGRGKPVTLYFPSPLRVALPKATAISLLLIAAANIGSLITSGDWSATSLKIHLLTTLIILSLIGLILLISYYVSRITSPFLIVDHDSLVVVIMGKAKEYELDTINSFLFDNTVTCISNRKRIIVSLFFINMNTDKRTIFSINHPYRLLNAWNRTAAILEIMTGKPVITTFYIQDHKDGVVDMETDSKT